MLYVIYLFASFLGYENVMFWMNGKHFKVAASWYHLKVCEKELSLTCIYIFDNDKSLLCNNITELQFTCIYKKNKIVKLVLLIT